VAAEAHRAEAERQQIEKQMVVAQLKTMQAQVEPHFLFNTLATVQHLVEVGPPWASRMLWRTIRMRDGPLCEERRKYPQQPEHQDLPQAQPFPV